MNNKARIIKALNSISQIPGRAYLLLAIIIFATASSVIRKLIEIGAQHLIDGRNPISFCNVLFAGNLCALVILLFIFHRQWNIHSLQQLSWTDWLSLTGVAILEGAIAPTLTFTALSLTMVNNVVLIGRIEPPIVLTLSIWLLRERVNGWVIVGAIVSFVGVALTVLLQGAGENMVGLGFIHVGKGELLTAAGALSLALSNTISKVKLRQIPLGIFTIFRTVVGTIVFSIIVIKLYGPRHFVDIFSPFLWQWMLLYGTVIVAGGILCWFTGLKRTSASEVALASSFSPVAGILAAYLILGEVPNMAQYLGASIILGGIVLNQIGIVRMNAKKSTVSSISSAEDMKIGFKGF